MSKVVVGEVQQEHQCHLATSMGFVGHVGYEDFRIDDDVLQIVFVVLLQR